MTCVEVRDLLGDVADARLAPGELAAWDAHLAACAECRREWASFQRTLDLLHGLPGHRAPAGFVEGVMAAAYPESWSRRLARRLFVPLRLKLPLEAAALVLVAVGAVYLVQHTPPIQTAIQGGAPGSNVPMPPAAPRPAPPTSGSPEAESARSALTGDLPGDPERVSAATRADSPKLTSQTHSEQTARATRVQPRATHETAKALSMESSSRDSAVTRQASATPAVVGRLVVEDPAAAERALGALNARVGATEVGRATAEGGLVVELDVPRAQYAEFSRGLAHLGRWTPGEERVDSGAALRVRVTVVRPPPR